MQLIILKHLVSSKLCDLPQEPRNHLSFDSSLNLTEQAESIPKCNFTASVVFGIELTPEMYGFPGIEL